MISFELDGHPFGDIGQGLLVRDFTLGGVDIASSDTPNDPGRGGSIPGRGILGTQTLAFDLFSNENTEADARRAAQALAGVWLRRRGPRELAVLRIATGGRVWRVYGRPRRWVPPRPGVVMMQGRADIACDFEMTDPAFYDDGLRSVTYSGVGQTVGGLLAPLSAPLSTRRTSGSSARFVTVEGDAPAPLAVRFSGPAVNPRLWTADGSVDVRLRGSLAFDQAVTVDAREMTVLRQDGASVPSMLAPRTRLADLVLSPGQHELMFSAGAESSVTVAWRDAWRSL